MSDQFDKILNDKINDSLEHHKIPYDPNHWEQLKAKKNKKKRRGFIYWRAASILMVLALSGFFVNYFINTNVENKIEQQKVNSEKQVPNNLKDSIITKPEILITETESNLFNNTTNTSNTSKVNSVISKKNIVVDRKVKQPINTVAENIVIRNEIIKKELTTIEEVFAKKDVVVDKNYSKIAINTIEDENIEEVSHKKLDSVKIKNDSLKNINKLDSEELNSTKGIKNKLKMGVLISSLYNTNQTNSTDNISVASGISFEIPIIKNLELFTGAIYSNQSFDLIHQGNNLNGIVAAKGNNTMVLKSRATSVSGLEIPLNLKYNFKIDQKKLFVTAGVSSIQYFNEEVASVFVMNSRNKLIGVDKMGNNFVQFELAQTQNIVETPIDSNKFELLGSLNFSAGILLPIAETSQYLIIEPYFKYSLNSVTSKQIDYSNVGVQLRYNFNLKK